MTPFPFDEPRRPAPPPAAPYDPLRLCVHVTVCLVAWAVGPPLAVAAFAALALAGYGRAYRRGLVRSRCALGDTRLVLAYLALAFVAGAAFAVRGWLG